MGRFESYVDICEKLRLLQLRPLACAAHLLRLVAKENPAGSELNFPARQKCPWLLFHVEPQLGMVLDSRSRLREGEGGGELQS